MPPQLEAYDRFWDAVYRERVFYEDGYKKGQAAGWADGREAGMAEGAVKNNIENAVKMKAKGFAIEDIAEITGLAIEAIDSL